MLRVLLVVLALCFAAGAGAEPPVDVAPKAPAKPAAKPAAKKPTAKTAVRPTWAELTAEQQQILAPLKGDWENLERERRLKWVGIAKRYPAMKPEEQARVQRRMQAWAKLTPEQRRQARENYKNIAKVPPEKRGDLRQQWADYQSLPPQEREEMVRQEKKRR